jgi:Ferritin-like
MKPITTLDDLHRHLQWALELEHSTIPPYLCALYSLAPGSNAEASDAIRAVVMEEMLHLVLVANVFNAVGGKPNLDHEHFVPQYPGPLPHSDGSVIVGLQRFSPAQLGCFMRIERPEVPHAEPQPDHYHSIGQFYDAILAGLECLNAQPTPLFTGNAAEQIDPTRWYYGGGGAPIVVSDLASAKAAIGEIKLQGEGSPDSIWDLDTQRAQVHELAHYYRFEEIRVGRHFTPLDTPRTGPTGALIPVQWERVLPMRANPKMADYADQPEVLALMRAFNRSYTDLLKTLHLGFNGRPGQLFQAVPLMYRMKEQALALMNLPCGDGSGETVGPSFEFLT